jgi:hypothetical protein
LCLSFTYRVQCSGASNLIFLPFFIARSKIYLG